MMQHRFWIILITLGMVLLMNACSTVEYTQETAPRMLINTDGTPFYRFGPAQSNGEDQKLAEGYEVRVMRKEFGYSYVELSNGTKGYVPNETLVTAPPEPSPTPTPLPAVKPSMQDTNEYFAPPGFRY